MNSRYFPQGDRSLPSRLPASLHRQLYRLAHWSRRQVWKVWRPRLEGVRVLAFDTRGRILLIRHSYGSDKWMPPGGGLGRSEDPVAAAVRELHEETGCRLVGARELGVLAEDLHGADNVVHLVAGQAEGDPLADLREIIDVGFFPLDALPERMPAGIPEVLRKYAACYDR